MVSTAATEILATLTITIVLEVAVAFFFGLSRALWAVVAVNMVTNPVSSALVATLYGVGVGFGSTRTESWVWPLLGVLEVAIVVAEWRLLVWALAGKAGTSLKLLVLSVVMNAFSGTFGTLILRSMILWQG